MARHVEIALDRAEERGITPFARLRPVGAAPARARMFALPVVGFAIDERLNLRIVETGHVILRFRVMSYLFTSSRAAWFGGKCAASVESRAQRSSARASRRPTEVGRIPAAAAISR